MSNQGMYELDEGDAPAKPKKVFIPGLEQPVSAPAPVVAPIPSAPVPVVPVAPPPAAAPPAADDDPDLKPGSRKDLWNCPHCGTGNRPERDTCRGCGKRPDQAKAPPVFLQPWFLITVLVVLVAAVAAWKLTRPDLHLAPASAAGVDAKVRRGPAPVLADRPLAGFTFTPKGRLSVCGRVVATHQPQDVPGVISVVLALGPSAADGRFDQIKPVFQQEIVEGLPPGGAVLLHLVADPPLRPEVGAYLSVVGDYGQLADGAQLVRPLTDGYTVQVDRHGP